MLFRKKIEPRCAYCTKGSPLNENEVACVKRGIVDAAFHCGGFCYDPLKRVPARPRPLPEEDGQKDYSL